MSAPAISRHLSVLENAGLVSSERRGQFVLYKLVRDNLVSTVKGFATKYRTRASLERYCGRVEMIRMPVRRQHEIRLELSWVERRGQLGREDLLSRLGGARIHRPSARGAQE